MPRCLQRGVDLWDLHQMKQVHFILRLIHCTVPKWERPFYVKRSLDLNILWRFPEQTLMRIRTSGRPDRLICPVRKGDHNGFKSPADGIFELLCNLHSFSGAFPEYTYISRKSAISDLPYEFRLMQAIKVSGFLTSLVGPSKMGKTILCEKVIGFEHIVEIFPAWYRCSGRYTASAEERKGFLQQSAPQWNPQWKGSAFQTPASQSLLNRLLPRAPC